MQIKISLSQSKWRAVIITYIKSYVIHNHQVIFLFFFSLFLPSLVFVNRQVLFLPLHIVGTKNKSFIFIYFCSKLHEKIPQLIISITSRWDACCSHESNKKKIYWYRFSRLACFFKSNMSFELNCGKMKPRAAKQKKEKKK